MPTNATRPATTAAPTARRRKYSAMAGSPLAAGVPHEVDGGEVGDDDDGEDAAEHRRRVDPAVPGIAGDTAGGHTTGGDGAGDGAHAVRDEDGGEGEGGAEVAAVTGAEHGLAEGEARAAQHDAEGGEGERDEQGQRDRGVGLGEAGPQHDEDEDQPDVVGLPHRSDGVVDHLPRARPALGAAGDEVPEAGAEVGAAEHGVGRDGEEQHDGDRRAHARVTSSSGSAAAGAGPLGRRAPRASPTSRVAEPLAHLAQDQHGGDAEPDVEQR